MDFKFIISVEAKIYIQSRITNNLNQFWYCFVSSCYFRYISVCVPLFTVFTVYTQHTVFGRFGCSFFLSHMCRRRRTVGFYWLYDISLLVFPSEPYLITVINFDWISLATYCPLRCCWNLEMDFVKCVTTFGIVNQMQMRSAGLSVPAKKKKKIIETQTDYSGNLRQWSKQCMFMIHISIHEMHFADNIFHSIVMLHILYYYWANIVRVSFAQQIK